MQTDGAANCVDETGRIGTRFGETFGETGADGEIVWAWHPGAGVNLVEMHPAQPRLRCIINPQGDGGKKAGHRGERI